MSQQELLKKVIHVLDANNIQYMVTGSIVSSLQGEPRSTHDIDFVVAIQKSSAKQLVEAFPPPGFFLDEGHVISAIETQGMFNLIGVTEGDKVDFWTLTGEPFDRSRFARRIVENITGIKIWVSTPEDTILMKLKWTKLSGGSEKQYTDALRVYEVQHETLDKNYLKYWVEELQLGDLWKRLTLEAELP